MFNKVLVCLLVIGVSVIEAAFSSGFQTFLQRNYGSTVANQLARNDLGVRGSFGGGSSSRCLKLTKDPIVLWHGLSGDASTMRNMSDFFTQKGYRNDSLFATSYGPNGTAILPTSTLLCEYVKQVRNMILAVHKYTQRKVIVAGFSLGSTMSRKAILGGRCVDTNEYIGGPLTSIVSRFVSAAGANQGHILCLQLSTYPICNNVTGLFPNASLFIKDINSKQHYEGKSTFLVASLTDDSIGFAQARLPAADINVTISGFTHVETSYNTLNMQYQLVTKGYLTYPTLQIDLDAQHLSTGKNCTGTIQANAKHQAP